MAENIEFNFIFLYRNTFVILINFHETMTRNTKKTKLNQEWALFTRESYLTSKVGVTSKSGFFVIVDQF